MSSFAGRLAATETPTTDAPRVSPWLQHITRVTSSGRFIPEIDGLRFIAIAAVVLYHLFGYVAVRNGIDREALTGFDRLLAESAHCGAFGVQLFFVISGFVLALPFAESRLLGTPAPRLRDYYLRRVTRLEPPYFINLLLLYPLVVVVTEATPVGLFPHLLASLGYVHNQVYGTYSPLNAVAWTLEIEVQFYLIAPLLTRLFAIRNILLRRAILVSLIAGFGKINSSAELGWHYHTSIAGSLEYFLAGFLLADWYLLEARKSSRTSYGWDAVALVSATGIAMGLMDAVVPRGVLPLLVVALYASAFGSRLFRTALRLPAIWALGGMCYTLYLYHYPVISGLGRITTRFGNSSWPLWGNFALQCALLLPAIAAVGVVCFVAFERPFMKRDWPQRLKLALGSRIASFHSSEPASEVLNLSAARTTPDDDSERKVA